MWKKSISPNQKWEGHWGGMGKGREVEGVMEKQSCGQNWRWPWAHPIYGMQCKKKHEEHFTGKQFIPSTDQFSSIPQLSFTRNNKLHFWLLSHCTSNTFSIAQICINYMPVSWVCFPKREDSEIFSGLLLDIYYHWIWRDKLSWSN